MSHTGAARTYNGAPEKVRLRATNFMIAPAILGDPFTSLDVSFRQHVLITGAMSGAVHAWHVGNFDFEQVSEMPRGYRKSHGLDAGLEELHRNEQNGRTEDPKKREFFCQQLCKTSPERISDVWLDEKDQVFAIVGDHSVKKWDSINDVGCDVEKFRRLHNQHICNITFTVRHESTILLLTQGQSEQHKMDTSTMQQETVTFVMERTACPCFYNGTHLVVMTRRAGDRKLVDIHDCKSGASISQLAFPKGGKAYWGFHLSGSRLAHVCCGRKIKVHDLKKLAKAKSERSKRLKELRKHKKKTLRGGAGDKKEDADLFALTHFERAQLRAQEYRTQNKNCVVKFTSHKRAVVAFLFHRNGEELISLGSDRKIKVWNVKARRSVRTYFDVKGSFVMGYPYLLRAYGRYLLYTADEGVFVLHMEA